MTQTTSPAVVRIVATPIIHETHGRVLRRTWAAALVLDNGERVLCTHRDGHRSIEAAAKCATKLSREYV